MSDSLIPDSVKNTFGDILQAYADLQNIKIQTKLNRAMASAAAMDLASPYSNPQAKTFDLTDIPNGGLKLSGTQVMIAMALVGLGVYLVAK